MNPAIADVLTMVLTACVPPIAAIAAGALWKLWAKLGFEATATDKANMEVELQAALSFGISKALPALAARGWDHADAHATVLTNAADYFVQRFPDRTQTIVTAANKDTAKGFVDKLAAVKDTLSARLPAVIASVAPVPAVAVPLPAPAPVILPAT